MEWRASLESLKTWALSCLDIALRVPFFFVLQHCNLATWDEFQLSGKAVLGSLGYMVGILGLFMTFNHLLLLYYWIVQLLFVLLLYMYFVEHDINQKGQSNNPTTLHVPVQVENQLSSESSFNLDNVYVHVIIVTSIIAASHSKWSEISPNMWEVGLFFFLPFGLQRFLAPYTQTSNVYHGLYLVCLCILVIFILYKAFMALTVVWELLYNTITRVCFMINTIGWLPVFVYHWRRVNLAQVLLVSWLIKFTSNLVIYQSVTEKSINWAVLTSDFCECCVSFVDLIAVGVVVSNISKYALWLVRLCLRETTPGQQHGNREGEGWNLGFVFFLLALQCGLTEAKSAERFVMIGLILVIILSLLVQSAFEIAEPSLATLGVTYTGRLNFYHVRVLAVSLLLLFVSVVKVSMLFSIFQLDPWLIALVFSDMDNIVQIVGALAVYILFIVNVHLKTPWEELDDYIYYVKAVCKVFEFLVALSAVVMCVLAALSGHWNLIGAVLISLHAYHNVYKRAQEGWKNFLLRRNAVRRLNSLQWATEEELNQLNDVCPICFDELTCARVTRCNHFFHNICLRKWLYVQNKCPLCHVDILPED